MEPVNLERTVFTLALLPVVVLLFAAVPCFSEPPVNQVVLRFPLERSLGKLYRMKIVKPADPQVEGALYAEARGNVTIPANTKLLLQISDEGAADLKPQYIGTSMPQLLHLDLCATPITARGLKSLASLKALQKLELDTLLSKAPIWPALCP
jgi:hypothetical protein